MGLLRPGLLCCLAWLPAACATAPMDEVDGPVGAGDGGARPDGVTVPDAPVGFPDARPPDAFAGVPDAAGGACTSSVSCYGAPSLGSVSGDNGGILPATQGYLDHWASVRVTEDNDDVVGQTLRVRARLTSPPTANFDLFLYVNEGSDVIECSTIAGGSTSGTGVDQVTLEWGEGTFANGSDDSRTVSIQVKAASGTCAPGQTWTLEVIGDP